MLMIVFIHSGGIGGYQGHDLSIDGLACINLYDLLRMLISRILSQVAVPLFFIISGYLFYMRFEGDRWDWGLWKAKTKSRIYTLLIPFLFWNILYFLYNEGLCLIQSLRHGEGLVSGIMVALNKVSPKMFFNIGLTDTGYINWNNEMTMMCVPVHVPFWYVRDLILMVLLSPLIWLFIKRLMGGYILVLLTMYIAMPFEHLDIRGLVFFSIGGYLQLLLQKYKIENVRVSVPLLGISILLFLMMGIVNVFYRSILPLTVLVGIIAMVMLSLNLSPKIKVKEQLSGSSFFIFAFHMFLIVFVNTIYGMSHIEIQNNGVLTVLYLALPIVYCALSYAIYLLVCQVPFLSLILLGRKKEK